MLNEDINRVSVDSTGQFATAIFSGRITVNSSSGSHFMSIPADVSDKMRARLHTYQYISAYVFPFGLHAANQAPQTYWGFMGLSSSPATLNCYGRLPTGTHYVNLTFVIPLYSN